MDIVIYQYRTFSLTLTLVTALGNPFSLAGYTVAMMIKPAIPAADSTAIWSSESPVGTPAFGVLSFIIPPVTTGTFAITTTAIYDIAIKDPTGAYISTILTGAVTVTASTRQAF